MGKCTDNETGEVYYELDYCLVGYDEETGEVTKDLESKSTRKSKFNVPKSFLRPFSNRSRDQEEKCCLRDTKETFTLSRKERVINLKEVCGNDIIWIASKIIITLNEQNLNKKLQEIILGYNKTSHRLFLIPSLLFFPKFVAIMIVLIEVLLHVWAHSKNATNDNINIYYRSPLHPLTLQFCTLCREEVIEVQVNKMQEERFKKFHLNFNQVAANLKTCT